LGLWLDNDDNTDFTASRRSLGRPSILSLDSVMRIVRERTNDEPV